jgi:RHS repeat-associated protein
MRLRVANNDGNMTTGYTPEGYALTMTYDAENRIKTAKYTDSSSVLHKTEYYYNGFGLLSVMRKYDGGVLTSTTRYLRAGFLPVQERDASNAVTREYTWGLNYGGGIGGLLNLKQKDENQIWKDYSYLYDGKGNIVALIDPSQVVAASYAYDPYGRLMKKYGLLDQPYMFSTKEYDLGTGLSYYGYRYYNSAIGKWTTRDPIEEKGGINLYQFVGNNPVNWIDPWGLYHCVGGANCDFTPDMDAALQCFDTCTGRDTAVTGGRGNRNRPNSSHARGEACDAGRNSNPDLPRDDAERCTLQCFPNGYGQEEQNGPNVPGTHYHMQLNTVPGGQPGFGPGIQPYRP